MLVIDDTGDTQSQNSTCITSNAIFSHFIFGEKHRLWIDATQKLLDIYHYDPLFKLKCIMFASKLYQGLLIFSIHHDLK